MAKPLVSDGLWERIEPLLPVVERRFRYPGRKRVADRDVLTGILFVLKTGIPWEDLPQEMGCGSGMTCWRRLRDWNDAGVWERLHQVLLDELQDAGQLDWSRAVVDSSHVRAKGGRKDRSLARRPAPAGLKAPPDLRRAGHPLGRDVDRREPQRHHRAPVARGQSPADRALRQFRPKTLLADRAYDSRRHRQALKERGITPRIAKRKTEHGSGLGKDRWVIERTISWLHRQRRLDRRYDKRADIHEAFLTIGAALICHQQLQHSFC